MCVFVCVYVFTYRLAHTNDSSAIIQPLDALRDELLKTHGPGVCEEGERESTRAHTHTHTHTHTRAHTHERARERETYLKHDPHHYQTQKYNIDIIQVKLY